mmetsp:Transcript_17433/g.29661  ORF Transcript_17433/g.29661 Transcript_17433/m.29661 type:complete len:448 (+) Transcript_17433:33-1376(+)
MACSPRATEARRASLLAEVELIAGLAAHSESLLLPPPAHGVPQRVCPDTTRPLLSYPSSSGRFPRLLQLHELPEAPPDAKRPQRQLAPPPPLPPLPPLAPLPPRQGASRDELQPACSECWVTTQSSAPFRITSASALWCETWEWSPDDIVGRPISVLDGAHSNGAMGRRLAALAEGAPSDKLPCVSESKLGQVYRHELRVMRVGGNLLAISTHLQQLGATQASRLRDGDVDALPGSPITRRNTPDEASPHGSLLVEELVKLETGRLDDVLGLLGQKPCQARSTTSSSPTEFVGSERDNALSPGSGWGIPHRPTSISDARSEDLHSEQCSEMTVDTELVDAPSDSALCAGGQVDEFGDVAQFLETLSPAILSPSMLSSATLCASLLDSSQISHSTPREAAAPKPTKAKTGRARSAPLKMGAMEEGKAAKRQRALAPLAEPQSARKRAR